MIFQIGGIVSAITGLIPGVGQLATGILGGIAASKAKKQERHQVQRLAAQEKINFDNLTYNANVTGEVQTDPVHGLVYPSPVKWPGLQQGIVTRGEPPPLSLPPLPPWAKSIASVAEQAVELFRGTKGPSTKPLIMGGGMVPSISSLAGAARGLLPQVARGAGVIVKGGRAAWAAAKAAAAGARGRIAKIPKRTLVEIGATAIGVGVWLLPSGETVQESRRRMNPLNPRALARAQRRVCSFARFATQSYAISGIVRRRRRRGPCSTKKSCR